MFGPASQTLLLQNAGHSGFLLLLLLCFFGMPFVRICVHVLFRLFALRQTDAELLRAGRATRQKLWDDSFWF